jgi:hypothetical protein
MPIGNRDAEGEENATTREEEEEEAKASTD